jgi:protein SCO1/2
MTRRNNFGRIFPTAAILLAALAAGLGLWLGTRWFGAPTQPAMQAALLYPQPRVVPEFALVRADGKPLTRADWHGHWTLAFFGFTQCPDVCPTTLAVLKQVWAKLDPTQRSRVVVDFVSIDPQRDTPEQLGKYTAYFSPDFIAATGTDEQLTLLSRALGLVYARTPAQGTEYSVDHSAQVVIIDPQGRLVGIFRPPLDAIRIVADLNALLASQ